MKLKKTVAKNITFAVALGIVSFVGFVANKTTAQVAALDVEFDGVSGITTVTPAPNKEYVWGIAKKMKKTPKADKVKSTQKELADGWYEVKSFEPVYGGKIDAAAASKGKAVSILVVESTKANGTKPEATDYKLVNVEGPDKNFKVVYSATKGKGIDTTDDKVVGDGASGYLAFFKTENKKVVQFMPTGTDVQLKKGKNGAWKDLELYFKDDAFTDVKGDARLDALVQNGAELTFRLKGSATQWTSKEVKVKVTKTPNAPKVKVDVHKDTVSLKKGMMYKVMLGDTALQNEKELTDPKKNTFVDLKIKSVIDAAGDDAAKKQTLEVYSKGAGKKLASKKAVITLQRQTAPVIGKDLVANGGSDKDTLKNQGGVVVSDKAQDPTKDFVTFKLNVPYDPSKGATLENASTETDYEFWIDYDGTQRTPKKWISLKKTKDAEKPTKVKVKASDSKKEGTFKPGDASSVLHIRVAGDHKSSQEVIKLGSAPLDVKLKVDKVEQPLKLQLQGANNVTDSPIFNAVIGTNTEYSFKVFVKYLVKNEAKPKLLKVKAKNGISVKAEAFDGTDATNAANGSAAVVTIKVDDKKIKDVENEKVEFEFNIEGVKKAFIITLKKS